jgi:hypothetical protein
MLSLLPLPVELPHESSGSLDRLFAFFQLAQKFKQRAKGMFLGQNLISEENLRGVQRKTRHFPRPSGNILLTLQHNSELEGS